jgi:hypothetical protein
VWFSVFCLLLLIAIVYFIGIQGLFSALIMLVCTLVALVATFSCYEYVAAEWISGWSGFVDYALAISFGGIFGLTLIVLRVAADMVIRRAGLLPAIVDRAGAVAIGIPVGLLVTGVVAITAQLMPWGPAFLGFQRIDPETGEENGIWLAPDAFTVEVAKYSSAGVFSGGREFEALHPDLLKEIGWSRTAPLGVRRYAPTGSLTVKAAGVEGVAYTKKKATGRNRTPDYDLVKPAPGYHWIGIRASLSSEALPEGQGARHTRYQVRLVGFDDSGKPFRTQYPVIGMVDHEPGQSGDWIIIDGAKVYEPQSSSELAWLFEVPLGFVPEFIEYKFGARAPITPQMLESDKDVTPDPEDIASALEKEREQELLRQSRESRRADRPRARLPERAGSTDDEGDDQPSRPSRPRRAVSSSTSEKRPSGDRVSGSRVQNDGDSHFGDDLPMVMTDYEESDTEFEGNGVLKLGHLTGFVEDQGVDSPDDPIDRFYVPANQQLFQLYVSTLHAKSLPGRALSQVVKTLQQYKVTDSSGNSYPAVGQFAIADVDGDRVIEVQYYPEYAETGVRSIRPFELIQNRHLEGDYEQAILFLVPSGVTIVEYSGGRTAEPLDKYNFVAPN